MSTPSSGPASRSERAIEGTNGPFVRYGRQASDLCWRAREPQSRSLTKRHSIRAVVTVVSPANAPVQRSVLPSPVRINQMPLRYEKRICDAAGTLLREKIDNVCRSICCSESPIVISLMARFVHSKWRRKLATVNSSAHALGRLAALVELLLGGQRSQHGPSMVGFSMELPRRLICRWRVAIIILKRGVKHVDWYLLDGAPVAKVVYGPAASAMLADKSGDPASARRRSQAGLPSMLQNVHRFLWASLSTSPPPPDIASVTSDASDLSGRSAGADGLSLLPHQHPALGARTWRFSVPCARVNMSGKSKRLQVRPDMRERRPARRRDRSTSTCRMGAERSPVLLAKPLLFERAPPFSSTL